MIWKIHSIPQAFVKYKIEHFKMFGQTNIAVVLFSELVCYE